MLVWTDEMRFWVFFLCAKFELEVKKCVQELHWHVPSANSVTTIRLRIRKHIRTEWKPRNIADFARLTQCTRKLSSLNKETVVHKRVFLFMKGV